MTRTPFEHRIPVPKAKADEFNKFYWIGKWYDTQREATIADRKLGALVMTGGSAAMMDVMQADVDRLRKETAEAYENARHFGALI